MTHIAIGPHERADNAQSVTGWHNAALQMISKSFNASLKEYQDDIEGKKSAKTAEAKPLFGEAVYLRPFHTANIKTADFAEGPDTGEMEQALEQLAERQIAARAPALMPYWLGFQLLKKTDDNTRACGIFAFKVGEELVYIPVFCINGELQGHELMYIVSQDRFLPSDEKQVNYLLSRKPLEPGKVELRDRSSIKQRASLRPDMMQSGFKLSSLDIRPGLPKAILEDALRRVFKEAAVTNVIQSPRFKFAMNCLNVADLFEMSAKAVKLAAQWSDEFPVYDRLLGYVLNGLDIHSLNKEWEKRAEIAKSLGIVPRKKPTLAQYLDVRVKKAAVPAPEPGSVSVKTAEEIPPHQFRFMSTEAIDRLHRNGYYVADSRDQTKLASIAEMPEPMSITGPNQPGFYNVFMADGTFKKCVILDIWASSECCVEWRTENCTKLVLDTETGKCLRLPSSDIIVEQSQPEGDWFKAVVKGSLHAPMISALSLIKSGFAVMRSCCISSRMVK